jgi:hypothetical protein
MQEEISVVVACEPMWQNMQAYQSPTIAELLLVSTQ